MSDLANKKCVPCEGNIPPFDADEIAEEEGHHPDLWFGWGYARIKIYTHAIKGLAESDFILAAKIDQISSV